MLPLQLLVAKYRLGLVSQAEALDATTEFVEGREVSPDMLARVYSCPNDAEVEAILQDILRVEGVPWPDERTAARTCAEDIAKQVVEGAVPPYEGAYRIWTEVWQIAPSVRDDPYITQFVGLASEWQDNPEMRASYEHDMLEAARLLISE